MSIWDRFAAGVEVAAAEETIALASELATELPAQSVIELTGELGSGKTTFVKGLASAWRIQEPITSPTFNICNLYKGKRQLAHMDAYRLDRSPAIWDELMLEELLEPEFCLAIEWPGKLPFLPWPSTLSLEFAAGQGDQRRIRSTLNGGQADLRS